MIEFNPPKELIDEIELKSYFILPSKFTYRELNLVKHSALFFASGYFSKNTTNPNRKITLQMPLYVPITEMLRNARAHGGSKDNRETTLGIFLNKDYICVGCHDGGDYFQNPKVKNDWEQNKHLTEFHKAEDEIAKTMSGVNFGKIISSEILEKIYIDSREGIFYGRINVRDPKWNLENLIIENN